ncbi:unnamed protein product [Arctia plantaginis]|uniref:Uncharacterized protein n=1 Tax=Arctia plantaginis TaxID=874455 RepID=A0A8S1A375_ARCPL|nr:unnamed protein product [Arctia plantaginis]
MTTNSTNRLRSLFNVSHWNHEDDSWNYNRTHFRDFSSLFNVHFKEPAFKVPTIDVSTLNHKVTPVSYRWISPCIVVVLVVLRMTVCAQKNNSDNGSFRLLDNSECSPQSDSHSDLPKPYFECVSNNDEVINKNSDDNSEELPPPYSTCLETLNNTDEIPKVHEGQSVEELQSRTDAEVHLNNTADAVRSTIVQNSSDDVTLRVVETTIDIDIDDRLASNQTKMN